MLITLIKDSFAKYLMVLAVLAVVIFLFLSLSHCVPGLCTDNGSQQCGRSVCLGESLSQHLSEKAFNLRNVSFKDIFSLSFLSIISPLTAIYIIITLKPSHIKDTRKYFFQKLFDYLLQAFSDGRLRPKLYL